MTRINMDKEKRIAQRFEVMAQIRVKRGRINYIMQARNLSRSGIYISTDSFKQLSWVREEQELEMDLFSSEHLENIRLNGFIVRVNRNGNSEQLGFAVSFTAIPSAEDKKLSHLIELAASGAVRPPPLPMQ